MDDNTVFVSEPISVSVTVLYQMFLYLASLNVDVDALLGSLGLDPLEVKTPDTRLPVATYLAIQEAAAEFTGDACFGLHMGEYAEAGSWSILGYLMMNCKDLRETSEITKRYSRIIGNMIETETVFQLPWVKFKYFTPPQTPKMSRHCFESAISSSLRMMRSLTGVDIHPHEVTFIYPKPEVTAEYERVFGCPVRFGQKDNAITFDLSVGFLPIRMANPALREYFETYARNYLEQMDQKQPLTRQVTRLILSRLDDEKLSIGHIARDMSISVRTLQARLSEEGRVFSELLQEIRENLAKKYLHENYTVEDITFLLGFSDPVVFRKAFKKWTGLTPREFREKSNS